MNHVTKKSIVAGQKKNKKPTFKRARHLPTNRGNDGSVQMTAIRDWARKEAQKNSVSLADQLKDVEAKITAIEKIFKTQEKYVEKNPVKAYLIDKTTPIGCMQFLAKILSFQDENTKDFLDQTDEEKAMSTVLKQQKMTQLKRSRFHLKRLRFCKTENQMIVNLFFPVPENQGTFRNQEKAGSAF